MLEKLTYDCEMVAGISDEPGELAGRAGAVRLHDSGALLERGHERRPDAGRQGEHSLLHEHSLHALRLQNSCPRNPQAGQSDTGPECREQVAAANWAIGGSGGRRRQRAFRSPWEPRYPGPPEPAGQLCGKARRRSGREVAAGGLSVLTARSHVLHVGPTGRTG